MIAIVIIIIAVAAYFFMFKNSKPVVVTDLTSFVKTYNIEIKDNIASPDSLKVKVGETVIWTNKDSIPHTITSNMGKELNSKSLKTGETYSHVFNKTGAFSYHSEVNPNVKGTITVE